MAEECPVLPGQGERLHWSLTDPAAVEGSEAQKLVAFRDTVEQVRSRLAEFIPSARRAVVETGTTPDGGAR
jgi:arsenate reductase